MMPVLAIVGFFGYLAWLAGAPRDARAVAIGTAVVTLAALAFFALAAAGR